jgi:GcrA cell cycle regulator
MNATPRPWGESEDAKLAKLWAEGLSARQIAEQLGTGRSRNAVIGRIHRRGLGRRADPNRRLHSLPRPSRRKAQGRAIPRIKAEPYNPAAETILPLGAGVSLMELSDITCRFPIGDPQEADFTFCGRTRDCDGPYCIGHARIAYTPVTKRQKRSTERLANWLDRRSFKAAAQA